MASKDTRVTAEDLEVSGFFWVPSFEAYGSVAGLYDLGPTGCGIERNLLAKWREHYVLEDDMMEVRCSVLTPRPVLDASGHTSKFSDYMLTDLENKQLYRADQYIEAFLKEKAEKIKDEELKHKYLKAADDVEAMTREQMIACMEEFKVTSPEGHAFSTPEAFNLMFGTRVGPGARSIEAFLRPETAQGIFVNYPRLFNSARGQFPFIAAQVGTAYRNEISPRNGLVRVREFYQCEIEHFADPEALNDFPKFDRVKDLKVKLFPGTVQEDPDESKRVPFEITLEEAITKNILPHKTLAYYMGRTQLFMLEIGIAPDTIRFRQHRSNEKAHYARDCWDCELYTKSLGWLECVGIADRQSFDLTQHAKCTAKKGEQYNTSFVASVALPEPIITHRLAVEGVKSQIGRAFKKDAAAVYEALAALSEDEVKAIAERRSEGEKLLGGKPSAKAAEKAIKALSADDLAKFESLTNIEAGGKTLSYLMYTIADEDVKVSTRQFIPNVIEPSMGVGRVMTVLFEQAFYVREDGLRRVLRLKPFMAPYKCCVLPVSAKMIPDELMHEIRLKLRRAGISHQVDASGASIGKRYARTDELGTPFDITLDDKTVSAGTVTLRERDSMRQVRGSVDAIIAAMREMVEGFKTWEQVENDSSFEKVTAPATE